MGFAVIYPGVIMPCVGDLATRELHAAFDPTRCCELFAEAVWRSWPHAADNMRRRLLAVVESQAGCPHPGP